MVTKTTTRKRTPRVKVRPLREGDGRSVGLLVAGYYRELGTVPLMTVEDTVRLFSTPWLRSGAGFAIERGREFGGYAWARTTDWRGGRYIQIAIMLAAGFRSPETSDTITGPLLALVARLGAENDIKQALCVARGVDWILPGILARLGFTLDPVSMLGHRHELTLIPVRPFPPEYSIRNARLPEEKDALVALSRRTHEHPEVQGEPPADNYYDYLVATEHFRPDHVVVIEAHGEPVAHAAFAPCYRAEDCAYELMDIGVVPELRGRGVGAAIVSHFLHSAKAQGGTQALAACFSTNKASTLYWRLGFRPNPLGTYSFFTRPARPENGG